MEPKKIVKQFLKALSQGDHKKAHELCTLTFRVGHPASWLTQHMPKLTDIYVGKTVSTNDNGTVKDIYISYKVDENKYTAHARCVKEIKPYHASPDGTWGVNPISAIGKPKTT